MGNPRFAYVTGHEGALHLANAREKTPEIARSALHLLGLDVPRDMVEFFDDGLLSESLATMARVLCVDPGHHVITAAILAPPGDVLLSAYGAAETASTIAGTPRALVVAGDRWRSSTPMSVSCDADDLRRALGPLDSHQVRGVASFGEALDAVFELRTRAKRGNLVPESSRGLAEDALFRAALESHRVALDWNTIAAVATGLLRERDDEAPGTWEVVFIREVARRHEGITAPIPWPRPEILKRHDKETQLKIIAHAVQSVSDGDWSAVPAYVTDARDLVGAERTSGDLLVLGACGRALAAVADYKSAQDLLEEVLGLWLARSPGEGSHSLCELLRVVGIQNAGEQVRELLDREVPAILAAASEDSKAYVALAVGRALVQVGEHRDALRWLDGDDARAAQPEHVKMALARWLARAALEVGDDSAVDAGHASLRKLRNGESDQRYLADLDLALKRGALLEMPLTSLLESPVDGDEARRLLARIAPGRSARAAAENPLIIRQLLDEYRY